MSQEDFKAALTAKWREKVAASPKLQAFTLIDIAPNDYKILIDEWKLFRQKSDPGITDETLAEEFKIADIDNSDTISDSEFELAYDTLTDKSILVDPIKTLFDSADNSVQDGSLSIEEFKVA